MTLTTSNQLSSILIIGALSLLLLLFITSISFALYFHRKFRALERNSKLYSNESGSINIIENVERSKGSKNDNDSISYARVVDSSESGELSYDVSSANRSGSSNDTKFSEYLAYRDVNTEAENPYDPYLPLPLSPKSSLASLRDAASKWSNDSFSKKPTLPRIPRVLSKRKYLAAKEELRDGKPSSTRKKKQSFGVGEDLENAKGQRFQGVFSLVELNKDRESQGISITRPTLLHLPPASSYSNSQSVHPNLLFNDSSKTTSDSSLPYLSPASPTQPQYPHVSTRTYASKSNLQIHVPKPISHHPLPPTPTTPREHSSLPFRPSRSPKRPPLPSSPPSSSTSKLSRPYSFPSTTTSPQLSPPLPRSLSSHEVHAATKSCDLDPNYSIREVPPLPISYPIPISLTIDSPPLSPYAPLSKPHPFYRVTSGGGTLYKIDSNGSLLEKEFLDGGRMNGSSAVERLMTTNPDANSLRSATPASRPSTSFEIQRASRFL